MALTSILYRGPLASCNYSCHYCPFASVKSSAAEIYEDRRALIRFLAWLDQQKQIDMAVFFTPRGEALLHTHYQEALISLSHLIDKTVIQTNLSCNLDWLAEVNGKHAALWCSFHPDQIDLNIFLFQCEKVASNDIPFSVGVVGIKDNLPIIHELRRRLPRQVYLWVNAFKHHHDYYTPTDIEILTAIDPYFIYNTKRYRSFGQPCGCGSRVFSVNGLGEVRPCHFIDKVLGNIYKDGLPQPVDKSHCTNENCWCHIGYVHLEYLGLDQIFGSGILERIPCDTIP